jgi:hypothetical protein
MDKVAQVIKMNELSLDLDIEISVAQTELYINDILNKEEIQC